MKSNFLSLCLFSGAISGTLLLAGCGDDTSPETTPSTAQTEQIYGYVAQATGTSITVTDGSRVVIVDTGTATIVSDSGGNPSNLVPGMMVTVDTTAGVATMVTYDSNVEGMVVSNTITADNNGSMDVMGQTVIVDDMTMYDTGIDHASDIAVGTVIEVSGIVQDDGSILAKYMELKTDNSFEIKGIVSGIPDGTVEITSFNIGDCQINIDPQLTQFDGLDSAADLANGIEVEVKVDVDMATLDPAAPCPVTATKIELEDAMGQMPNPGNDAGGMPGTTPGNGTPGETPSGPAPVEIHGMAADAPVDNLLTIKSTEAGVITETVVMLTETTRYEGGSIGDIVADTKLTVVAVDDGTGQLAAELVVVRIMDVPVLNMVEVDGKAVAAPIEGVFDIVDSNDVVTTVVITPTTMIKGGTAADIMADSKLLVKGFQNADTGQLEAHKIEIDPIFMMEKVVMGGVVEAVDITAGTITVMGQTVVVTDQTVITGYLTTPIVADPTAPVTGSTPPAENGSIGTTNPGMNGTSGMVATAETPISLPPTLTLTDLEAALATGMVTHVNAYRDANGDLIAMHIHVEPLDSTMPVASMIKGTMTVSVTETATTYSVEGIALDLAAVAEGLPAEPFVDGAMVMVAVSGEYDATTGILMAHVFELIN
jgi:hypothetical protein